MPKVCLLPYIISDEHRRDCHLISVFRVGAGCRPDLSPRKRKETVVDVTKHDYLLEPLLPVDET